MSSPASATALTSTSGTPSTSAPEPDSAPDPVERSASAEPAEPPFPHAFGPRPDTDPPDLAAYFARIGYDGPRTADAATLAALVDHHIRAIPFENLDPFLGREVRLDLASLEAKLVHGGRGGYCFEHNTLLAHVLRQLGYRVSTLGARVLLGYTEGDPLPARGHMLLRVETAEGPHLVDVGFGGQSPTAPLRFDRADAQETTHETYRIRPVGEDRQLESHIRGEWTVMYRFGPQEQQPSDYELANYYLSTHPASHFVTGLAVARPVEGGRNALRGGELAFHESGGETSRRSLSGVQELRAVLADTFGIDLSGLDADHFARRTAPLF